MQGFRELRVWQAAMDLAVQVYGLTRSLPRHETYGLTSQLQRAAVSVPANIAEGNARQHGREYLHFISIARGTLAELDTCIELAVKLGYANPGEVTALVEQVAPTGRLLTALRNSSAKQLP
jgi:four helix bundle protein